MLLLVGMLSCLCGLSYGVVYLICKKNLYLANPLIFLMFALLHQRENSENQTVKN